MNFRKYLKLGLHHAITVAIVTIAAIAATIAITMNYLYPLATSITGSAKFIITDLHLSSNAFSITIKNIGNVMIKHVEVYLNDIQIISISGRVASSGAELTCYIIKTPSQKSCKSSSGYETSKVIQNLPNIVPGKTYTITVIVEFQNGERKIGTQNVVAST